MEPTFKTALDPDDRVYDPAEAELGGWLRISYTNGIADEYVYWPSVAELEEQQKEEAVLGDLMAVMFPETDEEPGDAQDEFDAAMARLDQFLRDVTDLQA